MGKTHLNLEERIELEAALPRQAGGQSQATPAAEPKGAPWKIAAAAWMKQNTEASNGWLAERLAMGSASRVSQVIAVVAPRHAGGLGRRANLAAAE